jgi:hypothetical protein
MWYFGTSVHVLWIYLLCYNWMNLIFLDLEIIIFGFHIKKLLCLVSYLLYRYIFCLISKNNSTVIFWMEYPILTFGQILDAHQPVLIFPLVPSCQLLIGRWALTSLRPYLFILSALMVRFGCANSSGMDASPKLGWHALFLGLTDARMPAEAIDFAMSCIHALQRLLHSYVCMPSEFIELSGCKCFWSGHNMLESSE